MKTCTGTDLTVNADQKTVSLLVLPVDFSPYRSDVEQSPI